MVWIYEDPLNKKESAAYRVLLKRLGKEDALRRTKIFSLSGYIETQKFKTAKEIEKSVFLDKARQHPIFNKATSEALFKKLKQSGGKSGYPFTNFMLSKVKDSLPGFIKSPIDTFIWIGTLPIGLIKKIPIIGDFADLGLDVLHGVVEVGVTSAEDIAKDIGGPVGAAGVTILVAIPSAIAALLAVGQGDGGQAVGHVVKIVPFIGGILSKTLNQVEVNVEKLKEHPNIASSVPFISEYVKPEDTKPPNLGLPAVGGKRFSTTKRKSSKWPKTMRHRRSVRR